MQLWARKNKTGANYKKKKPNAVPAVRVKTGRTRLYLLPPGFAIALHGEGYM